MAHFKIEITKVDSVYSSARLISFSSNRTSSKKLTKCQLYCFLLDNIGYFARYARSPRYYTLYDLCEYLHIISKHSKLSFDVVCVLKHINTPF